MIRTNNVEIDAMIEVLQAQRNEAQDTVALMTSKLRVQEALTASLQKQLDELAKPKAEEKKEGDT